MPAPRKDETKDDFMQRCLEMIVGEEGLESGHAFAKCNGIWESEKEKSHKSLRAVLKAESGS